MSRTRWIEAPIGMRAAVLLGVAVAALVPGASAGPQQKPKGDAPALTKPEVAALATLEKEILGLSKAAVAARDLVAAERALRRGLDVWPEAPKLKAEFEQLRKVVNAAKGPLPPVSATAQQKIAETAQSAYATIGKALADAALLIKSDHPERFERTVGLVRTCFSSDEALQKLQPAYFAPYYTWFSKEAVARFEAGDELLDGQWLGADKVADLDRIHSEWKDPWIIADESHEIRTTLQLRTAKQFLHYVGQYRRYVLSRLGPYFDLKHPGGKIPIYVTVSREELDEQLRKTGMGFGKDDLHGCATYMINLPLRMPIFACFDLRITEGDVVRLQNFDQLRIHFTRELTIQIFYEYNKHAANKKRGAADDQVWSTHALTRYLSFHVFDGLEWRLSRPNEIPLPPGQGSLESPFLWCKQNRANIPPLREFCALNRKDFEFPHSVKIATLLGWFLIEGEGGKYANRFYAMMQDMFRVQDSPKLFDERFAGVDKAALQKEWERFLESYTLD